MNLIELLVDPWSQVFMQRAFAVSVAAGLVCGVVGTFVVLRGMSFVVDALSHSVFPGVAIGYALGLNLTISGAAAGIATALAIAAISQTRRVHEDAIIGVFWAFTFGLGIVVVSTQKNYTGDLASFLFGQILGISSGDVWIVWSIGLLLVALTIVLRKELVTVSLDRETAIASGLSAFWLDTILYLMVSMAVVISLQAVGNILVLALLVTPAAAARLLTDRLNVMMSIAAAIGGGGALAGLYLSFYFNVASGGLIVMLLSATFLACWVAAPRHGLWRRLAARRARSFPAQTAAIRAQDG